MHQIAHDTRPSRGMRFPVPLGMRRGQRLHRASLPASACAFHCVFRFASRPTSHTAHVGTVSEDHLRRGDGPHARWRQAHDADLQAGRRGWQAAGGPDARPLCTPCGWRPLLQRGGGDFWQLEPGAAWVRGGLAIRAGHHHLGGKVRPDDAGSGRRLRRRGMGRNAAVVHGQGRHDGSLLSGIHAMADSDQKSTSPRGDSAHDHGVRLSRQLDLCERGLQPLVQHQLDRRVVRAGPDHSRRPGGKNAKDRDRCAGVGMERFAGRHAVLGGHAAADRHPAVQGTPALLLRMAGAS
ncbi:hypothetical protein D3C85_1110090 [compost metagenome]